MSTVLVVEDDASIAETVKELLEEEGHHVVDVRDGRAALAMLARPERPCLVLLDLMMPGMSGEAVLDAMQQDARLANIPVVVTSASSHTEQMVRGRAEVLTKPFQLDRLIEAVGRHCPANPPQA